MSISRKVAFPLIKDEDDYPPFPVELMWATSTDVPLEFVLDNIPLFATQATLGDKVRVREEDGRLVFEEVVGRSRNSLIRVVVYDGNRIDEVRSELKRLGCASESLKGNRIISVNVPEQVDLGTVQEYLAALEATDAAGYEEPILRHPERCRRLVIDSRHGDLMELQQVLSDLGLTHAEYAVLWHVGDTLVVDRGFLATWVADHPPNNVPQPLSVDDCETAISTLMGKGLLIELTEADITADLARWRAETLPISWGVARDREVGDVDFTEAGFHLEATITRLTFPQSSRRPAQGYNDEEAGLIRVFGETEKACQDAVQHLVDRIDQSPWHWSKASVRVDPIRRIGPWWVSRFVKASDGYEMVVRKS